MAARKKKVLIKFPKQMQKKLVFVFILITIILIGLIGRLMYIQKESGQKYEKIVLNQRGYDSETIPYQRGDIMDSKGTILATSVDVYNVILDCKIVNEDKSYVEPTTQALLTCFQDIDKEDLASRISENKDSRYQVLLKGLSYDEIQEFVEITNDTKANPKVKGVWFEKEYKREYPFDSLASKVLGFTASGNVGIGGLEDYYNDSLNGVNGRKYGYLNSDSNLEKTIKDAVHGNSLVTTLDMNVQSVVEKKIAEFNETYKNGYTTGPGSKDTAVVVMNVNNGEIIAMADSSGYNLNNPWDLSAYYTEEEIDAMDEEEKVDKLNGIWKNFCITYTFEPGSTIKPLTVATGLDSGIISSDKVYFCDGVQHVGGHDIHCSSRQGHGSVTLEESLMYSCNDALMQMADEIGVDVFTKYQNIFNIGLKTNIDLPGEAKTNTLVYTAENMDSASLATNAFGQNFTATMVQVASAISSVVNGGNYYQPHMVKRIIDEKGDTVLSFEPVLLKQTVSKKTSEKIKEYLYQTVTNGTADVAKVPGYSMGGKTGTAETRPRKNGKYIVSFIGYAPADNPEILIYVVINEPNVEEQAHSAYASALAKEILEEIFPYLNIFPDEAIVESPESGAEEVTTGGQEGQDTGTEAGQEGQNTGAEGQDTGVEGQDTGVAGQDTGAEAGQVTGAEAGQGGLDTEQEIRQGDQNIPEQLPDENYQDNSPE